MNPVTRLEPAAAQSLALWHEMVAAVDLKRLPTIVAATAEFRSPAVYKPYKGAPALCLILNTVMTVFRDFTYHRTFVAESGRDVVLEFSATVGDRHLKGIDMIAFDADGRIIDFEVMVRPFNALQALGEQMGARLAAFLPAFKG